MSAGDPFLYLFLQHARPKTVHVNVYVVVDRTRIDKDHHMFAGTNVLQGLRHCDGTVVTVADEFHMVILVILGMFLVPYQVSARFLGTRVTVCSSVATCTDKFILAAAAHATFANLSCLPKYLLFFDSNVFFGRKRI